MVYFCYEMQDVMHDFPGDLDCETLIQIEANLECSKLHF